MTQQFPQYEMVDEKAWDRIGLDEWSQLKWFVKLANTTNFETMTDGEQLLWKEEFGAMLSKASSPLIGVPPKTKRYPGSARPKTPQTSLQLTPRFFSVQMQMVRDSIAPHLDNLADDQYTLFKGFNITYTVSFHKNPDYDESTKGPRYLVYRGETGGSPQDRLLLRMIKLLETYADKIRRCKLCKKIFLQLKRTAKYCGPKCYTVGCMREFRAVEMMRKKRKGQDRKVLVKGGSRHGKAKR